MCRTPTHVARADLRVVVEVRAIVARLAGADDELRGRHLELLALLDDADEFDKVAHVAAALRQRVLR